MIGNLIAKLPDTKAIIVDKGYDSKCMREQITKKGARAVIPGKRGSLKGNADMDWGLYRYGHWVENTFARLKQCRAVTVRYDKLKRNFESMVTMGMRISVVTYVEYQQLLANINSVK